jgi:predicted nucleic acid-binding protein
VLLALTDPMHIHHESAHRWFVEKGQYAWATCPLTENGFIRIASHPNYPNRPGAVAAVLAIFRRLYKVSGHHFWPDDVGILQILESDSIITHAQITEVYLLGLAFRKRGKLATFDQRIPADAVRAGRKALELIIP